MSNRHRVVWFADEPNLKARAASAELTWGNDHLVLGSQRFERSQINSIELERVHGIGTTVRLVFRDNKLISLMIPRLNIAGQFVIVNRMATQRLYQQLLAFVDHK